MFAVVVALVVAAVVVLVMVLAVVVVVVVVVVLVVVMIMVIGPYWYRELLKTLRPSISGARKNATGPCCQKAHSKNDLVHHIGTTLTSTG